MFLKAWILIEQAINKNVGFAITGTFFKKHLIMKHLFVTVIMIYYTKAMSFTDCYSLKKKFQDSFLGRD